MLKKVKIKNFRSCKDVSLSSLTGLTVMLGRNGAGKTNILRAIEWAALSAVSNAISPEAVNTQSSIVELEFEVEMKCYKYFISLKRDEDNGKYRLHESIKIKEGRSWVKIVERTPEGLAVQGHDLIPLLVDVMTPSLALVFSLITDEKILESLEPVKKYLAHVRYYPIDEPSDMISDDITSYIVNKGNYSKWLSDFQSVPDSEYSVVMKIIHLWMEEKDKFDELKDLLGKKGLSIINDINVDSFNLERQLSDDGGEQTYYFINFFPDLDSEAISRPLRYSNLSYGTRRVLRILTAILHDESSVLLLEQPEDGVHSGLLNKLVSLLESYVDPSQFIITSHASGVIDKLNAKAMRLVAMKNAKTIVRVLTQKELDVIDDFICKEGSLSDFLESIEDD